MEKKNSGNELYKKQKYQEFLIDKLYGIGSFQEKSEFYENPIANQSLCFLLDFVEKHNPNLIKDISLPDFENHNEKLVLANHSLKQLNIINDNNYTGKLSSILSMLNNCTTSIGKRKFNYELLHPISNIEELNKSYNITEHLLDTEFYKVIRNDLNSIKDVEIIERKLIMNKLLLVVLMLLGTDGFAQQMAYNVVYVRAEENSEWQIGNLIETYYTDNKRKSGGVFWMESLVSAITPGGISSSAPLSPMRKSC